MAATAHVLDHVCLLVCNHKSSRRLLTYMITCRSVIMGSACQ